MVPPAPARALLLSVVATVLAIAACTASDEPTAEVAAATVTATVAPVATSTPVPPTPTAEPTATAQPTVTPTLEPTPTIDLVERAQADIELIKDVHTRFMTELFARDERDPASIERYLALAQELTADAQLEQIVEALDNRQARNERIISDGIVSNIGDIEVSEGGLVEVFDCSKPTGARLLDDGTAVPALDQFEWRATYLRLQPDGVWRVVAFDAQIDQPCSPRSPKDG